MALTDVDKPCFRFVVLFFNCLLTFGSYYCFDMPSVLQTQMQGNYTCEKNLTASNSSGQECCLDCLGMTGSEYNMLYAVYAWMNAVIVLGAGFLLDKLGNRVGVFVFSSLCVFGSSIFALGSMYRGTAIILPVMLLGRLIFGAGSGALTIVQNRITSYWFAEKELAFAFGVTLSFSRLGSVLNFFFTNQIYNSVGLTWTFWIGAMLCGIGFVSAVTVSFLDVYGVRKMGNSARLAEDARKVRVSDVKDFTSLYWLLILAIMFFYDGVFPFVADASKFIQDKYGYESNPSSYIAGAVYDVSMVFSPFLGGIIDVFGKRGYLSLACSLLTIPVFGLLAFSTVNPLISTLWLGVTYSIAAASLWPSIPLVVSQATVGTAFGIATSLQMIGIGISNLIVGQILGKNKSLPKEETLVRWKYVMIYLLVNVLACVATSVALNINDAKKGSVLNLRRRKVQKEDSEDAEPSETKPLLESPEIN